jgi:hypothetical protein
MIARRSEWWQDIPGTRAGFPVAHGSFPVSHGPRFEVLSSIPDSWSMFNDLLIALLLGVVGYSSSRCKVHLNK